MNNREELRKAAEAEDVSTMHELLDTATVLELLNERDRDREAIAAEVERMADGYGKRKQEFYDDLRNVHGDLCSDMEDELRSLIKRLRGEV